MLCKNFKFLREDNHLDRRSNLSRNKATSQISFHLEIQSNLKDASVESIEDHCSIIRVSAKDQPLNQERIPVA